MTRARASPRAVILLVVLFALVGLCGTTVVLTRSAAAIARSGATSLHVRIADDLLREAEGPIHDWLRHTSATVVLAPESMEPRVLVLDDAMDLGGVRARIRIEAVDACGPERINLSTFPMVSIREAMSARGLGGIEVIEKARSDGHVPPRLASGARDIGGELERVTFVNASPRWSIRLSIRVGRVERRWIAVYGASEGGWTCEERRWDDE
ncbi:MAG: hypothetical protein KIT19_12820 [Phycisphaeraceae bacterium]|nr:hypothetical protein [Phycisphaeraceae bacterium]